MRDDLKGFEISQEQVNNCAGKDVCLAPKLCLGVCEWEALLPDSQSRAW